MITIRLLFLSFTILFVSACSPDDGENRPEYNGTPNEFDISSEFGSQVTRDFLGQVTDVGGGVVKNATVKIGSTTVQTDDNGMFVINNASVYERFAAVKVTKSGYFEGSRTVVPGTATNFIKVTLLSATPVSIIDSGNRIAVGLDSGTRIIFNGDYVDESGVPFSGKVPVSLHELQPNSFLATRMPGMLYGADENGDSKVMNTYGMLSVKIRGAVNQNLQLEEGDTAEITMQMENVLVASAPSTIPMWYFDQEEGHWRQEGTASKKGSAYVGVVKHLGWWNFGEAFDPIVLSGTVNTSTGNPLQNTTHFVSPDNATAINSPGIFITDSNGAFRTMIAAGNSFTLNTAALCQNPVTGFAVGPYTSDTVLNTALQTPANAVHFQGNVVNCDNTALNSGYVLISNGTITTFAAVPTGEIDFSIPVCTAGENLTLEIIDFQSEQSTGKITYTPTTANVVAGAIQICNSNGFISYKIDESPVVYISDVYGNLAINDPEFNVYIRGNLPGQGTVFALYGQTTAGGIFNTDTIQLSIAGVSQNFSINEDVTNSLVFNFSNFGAVGQYADITFSGTFEQSGITHALTGTVHARRSN